MPATTLSHTKLNVLTPICSLENLRLPFHVDTMFMSKLTFNKDPPSINLQCAVSPISQVRWKINMTLSYSKLSLSIVPKRKGKKLFHLARFSPIRETGIRISAPQTGWQKFSCKKILSA